MRNLGYTVIICLFVVSSVIACGSESTSTSPALTPTPLSTDVPVSTATTSPTNTPFPTPAEAAPEETFTRVGSVAQLGGQHDVLGKAIVAGLQTLIIQTFTFDGKGPQADIRLVKGQDYADPAAVLLELESRPYEEEFLRLTIPSSVGPGDADSIAVYCDETDEVYAVARFQ